MRESGQSSANEGEWPVVFLSVSSSQCQCMVSVLIIAEQARGSSDAEI